MTQLPEEVASEAFPEGNRW